MFTFDAIMLGMTLGSDVNKMMHPFVAATARCVMEVEECCRSTKAEHQGVGWEISHCSDFTFGRVWSSVCRWCAVFSIKNFEVILLLLEVEANRCITDLCLAR